MTTTDPLDASDVLAALQSAVELAEVWLVDGGDGTLDDRIRLHALLKTLNWQDGRLTAVARSVEESIAGDLDAPRDIDGAIWGPEQERKIRGWRKDEMRSAINRWVMRPREDVDPETGEVTEREPTAKEALAELWILAEPATGRTKKMRDYADIDPDEYATIEYVDRVVKLT